MSKSRSNERFFLAQFNFAKDNFPHIIFHLRNHLNQKKETFSQKKLHNFFLFL